VTLWEIFMATEEQYLTAPVPSTSMPKGIPYIVTNEAAERFSFYGMKGILIIFMTKYLMDSSGGPDLMGHEEAKGYYHMFTSAVYFTPLFGAIIADAFLGKYRTILTLSMVYCAGHLALAMDETRMGLAIGLGLIALGSGGIKPCVSAHVGDQFGKSNQNLLEKVFGWFYFAINLGAFASTLLTPWLLARYGPHVAFGVPGLLMGLATIFFWMGRNVFIHIPPGGMAFIRETFSAKGLGSMARLFVIYAFVAMFWALFDQTGSAWVLQAERMDRNFLGFEWLPSQIQAINPIMIMILIPVFNGVKALRWPGVYPLLHRVYPLTPLRKISIGFFLTVPAFLIPAWIESALDAGHHVNIAWQLFAYALITTAEVFVSITCLEFSYTQAPKKMKSLIMACFLMSVSLGNIFVSGVNFFIYEEGPSFSPDVEGLYTLELTVSDGTDTLTTALSVLAVSSNPAHVPLEEEGEEEDEDAPPQVEAGRLVAVAPGEQVRLYASADSGDARGEKSYAWTVIDAPPDSRVDTEDLVGADTRNPTFVPDATGTFLLKFTYRVGDAVAEDTVQILATTNNISPVVEVGGPEVWSFEDGDPVWLSGDGSYDPNGDDLLVSWRLADAPPLSQRRPTDVDNGDRLTDGSKLDGATYYLFFAGCMFLTALFFIPVAMGYKEETYIQDEVEQS
jgi:POT family proton-dependent oligopeptide transporter